MLRSSQETPSLVEQDDLAYDPVLDLANRVTNSLAVEAGSGFWRAFRDVYGDNSPGFYADEFFGPREDERHRNLHDLHEGAARESSKLAFGVPPEVLANKEAIEDIILTLKTPRQDILAARERALKELRKFKNQNPGQLGKNPGVELLQWRIEGYNTSLAIKNSEIGLMAEGGSSSQQIENGNLQQAINYLRSVHKIAAQAPQKQERNLARKFNTSSERELQYTQMWDKAVMWINEFLTPSNATELVRLADSDIHREKLLKHIAENRRPEEAKIARLALDLVINLLRGKRAESFGSLEIFSSPKEPLSTADVDVAILHGKTEGDAVRTEREVFNNIDYLSAPIGTKLTIGFGVTNQTEHLGTENQYLLLFPKIEAAGGGDLAIQLVKEKDGWRFIPPTGAEGFAQPEYQGQNGFAFTKQGNTIEVKQNGKVFLQLTLAKTGLVLGNKEPNGFTRNHDEPKPSVLDDSQREYFTSKPAAHPFSVPEEYLDEEPIPTKIVINIPPSTPLIEYPRPSFSSINYGPSIINRETPDFVMHTIENPGYDETPGIRLPDPEPPRPNDTNEG